MQDHGQLSSSVEDIYEAGFVHRCNGEYVQAREAFNKVLSIEPKHLKSRWQLALIKGFEGDFDGSLEDLRLIVQDAPTFLDARYDFAMTLNMLGYFDEAFAEFQEILLQDPSHEKAKQQLAYFG